MKQVRLTPEALEWLVRHPYVSVETIISWVQFQIDERVYVDEDHFKLTFNVKKDKKFDGVLVGVHEKPKEYVVYQLHSTKPKFAKR
jgi:hypothetical protein